MKVRNNQVNFPRRAVSEHVPLHRLWAFANHRSTLELSEDGHVKACPECRESLQTCLQEKSFGAVLKQRRDAHEGAAELQSRPKLNELYIFMGRID